jgi:hypothetical protein
LHRTIRNSSIANPIVAAWKFAPWYFYFVVLSKSGLSVVEFISISIVWNIFNNEFDPGASHWGDERKAYLS